MVNKVFIHVGMPKTGTTYLQKVLWGNRELLAERGLLLPGNGHRMHLWSALELIGRDLGRRHPDAPGTLGRLLTEAREAEDTDVLLTHEFFCAATERQASKLVAELAPKQVELIITARNTADLVVSGWQEYVKNGGTDSLTELVAREFPTPASADSEFSWFTWDLAGILTRWSNAVPTFNTHILPLPDKGSVPEQHWLNFADVLGIDSAGFELPTEVLVPTLGVVQTELLRQFSPMVEIQRAVDRGVWLRSRVAEQLLGNQKAIKIKPDANLLKECRKRAKNAVEVLAEGNYQVHGELDSLLVGKPQRGTESPENVTADELYESALQLSSGMFTQWREARLELREIKTKLAKVEAELAVFQAESEQKSSWWNKRR